jgi:proline dehydrogenase
MLNFDNTEHAFAYKRAGDLRKARFLFKSIGNPWLTKIGVGLTNFAFKIGLPIKAILKKTIYEQFVGGEQLQEASKTAEIIYKYGVGVILDYGVEGKKTEEEFDASRNSFLEAITFAKGKPHIPFVSIKVTGLGRFALLQKLDEGKTLDDVEKLEYNRIEARLNELCGTAVQCGVMLLIDAEETWVQEPVDALALKMMMTYNKQKAFIFNTYQMYRHDRLEWIKKEHLLTKAAGIILGAKLVRGAYMEKERIRAEQQNYSSPIQSTKEATDNDYNEAVQYCINNHQTVSTFIGTHNEASCYLGAELMQKNALPANSDKVYFSQLYGMSDNISFNLAHAGYNVSKYLPYGLVEDVVPYLMRRAQENTSVKGQTGRELNLITKELQRRKIA